MSKKITATKRLVMQGAFGNFEIRSIQLLDESKHDSIIRDVMVASELDTLIVSDGCYYPVVTKLGRTIKVQRFVVLDPYTHYRTTCEAVIAGREGETLPNDGWRIRIEGGNRTPGEVHS